MIWYIICELSTIKCSRTGRMNHIIKFCYLRKSRLFILGAEEMSYWTSEEWYFLPGENIARPLTIKSRPSSPKSFCALTPHYPTGNIFLKSKEVSQVQGRESKLRSRLPIWRARRQKNPTFGRGRREHWLPEDSRWNLSKLLSSKSW